ncbi:hypothetical protein LCGC14_3006720, partial [marine sediment metagenome]
AYQEFEQVEDILKEWYAPAIVNQIYVKSPLWSQVKKSSKGVSGKRVYIPLRHTLSEAVGGNKSGVHTLPTPTRVQYDSTHIWQKRNYGRVRVDGYGIEASKGKGGWIDLFAGETRGIAEAFAIDIDQQVMGRGTGILGVVSGTCTTSGTTVTVDDPHGISKATPGFSWFRKGMVLDTWLDGTSASDAFENTGAKRFQTIITNTSVGSVCCFIEFNPIVCKTPLSSKPQSLFTHGFSPIIQY